MDVDVVSNAKYRFETQAFLPSSIGIAGFGAFTSITNRFDILECESQLVGLDDQLGGLDSKRNRGLDIICVTGVVSILEQFINKPESGRVELLGDAAVINNQYFEQKEETDVLVYRAYKALCSAALRR